MVAAIRHPRQTGASDAGADKVQRNPEDGGSGGGRGPAPGGGSAMVMAGIVVGSGFLFNFLGRGVVDTFMVFILPLEAEFGWSRSTLTGVYSIYLLVAGMMSPVSGTVLELYGPRITYGTGLTVLALAMFGASLSQSFWQICLFHGVLSGIAASALGIVPASALISRWFDRKLSIAIALAYAGFGSGILVIVPLVQMAIDLHGWRGAYRATALVLAVLIPFLLVLPWRRIAAGDARIQAARRAASGGAGARRGHWTVRQAMRTAEFWMLAQCFFFTACASYSVIVQVVPYLVQQGYPPIKAALAFGASGMLSVAGVISAGWLCVWFGFRFTVTLSFAATLLGVAALLGYSWLQLPALVLAYVLAFGISQGARGPVISTLTARIFAFGSVAAIFGAIFMAMSFGSALGAWVSGHLHDLTGDYRMAFVFSMLSVIGAVSPFWYSTRLHDPQPLPPPVDTM